MYLGCGSTPHLATETAVVNQLLLKFLDYPFPQFIGQGKQTFLGAYFICVLSVQGWRLLDHFFEMVRKLREPIHFFFIFKFWGPLKQIQGIRSDRVPEELWTEVRDIVQETGIKIIPKKKKCKKAKWLSEEALQIAVERRKQKTKEKRKDISI